MDTVTIPRPPTPDTRETRALALFRAHRRSIVLVDRDTYECPSQDGTRTYTVTYGHDADESCTCPDHAYRGAACVHLLAVGAARAKRRGTSASRLAALEERAARELLGDDERCEVRDAIVKMRRRLHA